MSYKRYVSPLSSALNAIIIRLKRNGISMLIFDLLSNIHEKSFVLELFRKTVFSVNREKLYLRNSINKKLQIVHS